jgi:protein-S-isoprenylcysteine O-methyltransferase Ste14
MCCKIVICVCCMRCALVGCLGKSFGVRVCVSCVLISSGFAPQLGTTAQHAALHFTRFNIWTALNEFFFTLSYPGPRTGKGAPCYIAETSVQSYPNNTLVKELTWALTRSQKYNFVSLWNVACPLFRRSILSCLHVYAFYIKIKLVYNF